GYISPEQARGEPGDSRSDVFGLGVLFFEILTGQRPFGGATMIDSIAEIVSPSEAPAPSSISSGVVVFDDLVKRCLAKSPGERITAKELRARLEPHAAPQPALGAY